MSLLFVKLLKDLPNLDQLRQGFLLAVGKFRKVSGETNRLCLVDEWLALFERPVSSR